MKRDAIIKGLVIVSALILYAVIFRDPAVRAWQRYFPCRSPIPYSIGQFDERFGIGKDSLAEHLLRAEGIWEAAAGKDLFKMASEGGVAINLIYDERQEATEKLQEIGGAVDGVRAEYERVRSEYESMKAALAESRARYELDAQALDRRIEEFNRAVAELSRGARPPRAEYDALTAEGDAIQSAVEALDSSRAMINVRVDALNAKVRELNSLAADQNAHASQYNSISEGFREFDEGTYRDGSEGRSIQIYQFDDEQTLVRLLVHEFGHALGIDHVEDPEAIMYYRNDGPSLALSESDVSALAEACGLK